VANSVQTTTILLKDELFYYLGFQTNQTGEVIWFIMKKRKYNTLLSNKTRKIVQDGEENR